MPSAVARGRAGYLRVDYNKLGLAFMTWDEWIAGSTTQFPRGANRICSAASCL
jgi:hypothetical protein